ncbi:MAG: putative CRISPR-associated protein [Planctomycetia bacterium]|nr:putative CRISPR-associated protein [Planctomycetia bacterium]
MPRTFICSTGTSAAKLLVDVTGNRLPPGRLREWVTQQGGSDAAARQMLASFQEVEPSGDGLHQQLSAEIHSLVRMNVSDDNRVLLLSSSTPEGLACALAVEGYLKRHWRGLEVVTEPVNGLQVDDAEQFRRVGVVEFTKRCLREINNYHAPVSGQPANVVLNPTGGFKALVPYMVLIGMIKEVPCRYIFERSTTLLELPPLPVEFSRSRFEAFKSLFERLERESRQVVAATSPHARAGHVDMPDDR